MFGVCVFFGECCVYTAYFVRVHVYVLVNVYLYYCLSVYRFSAAFVVLHIAIFYEFLCVLLEAFNS